MKQHLKKRKAMNYKILITASLIILSINSISAQNESETRNFIKTLQVSQETTLEVVNKYGTIQITPWSKDSVYIRAEVKAYAKDHARLHKMFDGITVNITDSRYLVRAQTEFTSNINTILESFKGMTSKIISYDSRIEINYFISIPEYLNLKIENKYGDVYMENCMGEFRINISNGSFKANSLGKNSSINMVFCDAKINSIVSGNIDASFSEISIGETEDLSINSISSKYDFKNAGSLRGESKRDKFFIENIESLQCNTYFTDFKITSLKKEINLTTRYGSLNADMIDKGFESIHIISNFSDLSLRFEPGSSYNLEVKHINTFLVLPEKNMKTEEKAINEDKKEYLTTGNTGHSPERAKVRIDATRGNIYLK
jgi:hypothetical protein